MTDRELRRLSREELLEMLIEQGKENEKLRAELKNAAAAADSRNIRIRESGTMAEAALVLNGVFESADAAAKQYLENIRAMQDETRTECDRMIASAREDAREIVKAAQQKATAIIAEASALMAGKSPALSNAPDSVDRIIREFNTEQHQN